MAHSSLALAASLLLAGACYDGDHLGFVPCEASDECDAPPRAKSRRDCLRSQVEISAPGYCALPCDSAEACADEAPGTAAQEAICMGESDMTSGHCVLPCNSSQPCPANMQCIGYSAASCDDSGNCICFPATLGAEG